MKFFRQSHGFSLPISPEKIPDMANAVERLVEYTGGTFERVKPSRVEFQIPPFIFAGRTKPLARLSSGAVEFYKGHSDDVSVRYSVRTSNTNFVASFVITAILFAVAVLAWSEGHTDDILVVAVVIALGPLFAFTLIQQSVSRFERELRDACLLASNYGEKSQDK